LLSLGRFKGALVSLLSLGKEHRGPDFDAAVFDGPGSYVCARRVSGDGIVSTRPLWRIEEGKEGTTQLVKDAGASGVEPKGGGVGQDGAVAKTVLWILGLRRLSIESFVSERFP
jgi:hypothetical protein